MLFIPNAIDRHTILAALRFYQAHGQTEADSRTEQINILATGGDAEISMDNEGIDDLCERILLSTQQPARVVLNMKDGLVKFVYAEFALYAAITDFDSNGEGRVESNVNVLEAAVDPSKVSSVFERLRSQQPIGNTEIQNAEKVSPQPIRSSTTPVSDKVRTSWAPILETEVVFSRLRSAYPEKNWYLEPYEVDGEERHAIQFTMNGIGIHDPFGSDNGMEEQADRYGLSEEDAVLMERHNREFVTTVFKATANLSDLYDQIVQTVKESPQLSAADFLDALGLSVYGTGSGCVAYAIFNPDGTHIFVTDNSGNALPDSIGDSWVGLYGPDDSEAVKGYFP
jgi:hypothetical protein